ncbi:hypothetical protein [Thermosulfurimonas sp. F29]|uniref:hypothetical protein n=1 Tax=Thermosulfurimonas sp. F29 TaxID=2867247 RepID=UPI001C82ADD8|nr:hypothetical protein [Thermosulfurimonas sp. F29]MBX6424227.1 hypothetical protein [Thermosulfurimonas sp. F29]
MERELSPEEVKAELYTDAIRQAERLIRRGMDQYRRFKETDEPEERRHLGFVLNMTLARLTTLFRILAVVTGNGANALATDIDRLLENEVFAPQEAEKLLMRALHYLEKLAGRASSGHD